MRVVVVVVAAAVVVVVVVVQMIIQRIGPLANEHPEDSAYCK